MSNDEARRFRAVGEELYEQRLSKGMLVATSKSYITMEGGSHSPFSTHVYCLSVHKRTRCHAVVTYEFATGIRSRDQKWTTEVRGNPQIEFFDHTKDGWMGHLIRSIGIWAGVREIFAHQLGCRIFFGPGVFPDLSPSHCDILPAFIAAYVHSHGRFSVLVEEVVRETNANKDDVEPVLNMFLTRLDAFVAQAQQEHVRLKYGIK